MQSGFGHGLSVSGWILNFARSSLLRDRRHDLRLLPRQETGQAYRARNPPTRPRVRHSIVAFPDSEGRPVRHSRGKRGWPRSVSTNTGEHPTPENRADPANSGRPAQSEKTMRPATRVGRTAQNPSSAAQNPAIVGVLRRDRSRFLTPSWNNPRR